VAGHRSRPISTSWCRNCAMRVGSCWTIASRITGSARSASILTRACS
jgi:hypothetical protein